MAARNGRTADQVRQDIEAERDQLADAVEDLRGGLAEATDIKGKLRSNLPAVAAGALGAGFFLAGVFEGTMSHRELHSLPTTPYSNLTPFTQHTREISNSKPTPPRHP